MTAPGLSLDSGALIAIEAGVRRVLVLVDETLKAGGSVHVVAGVLAQVWRGGPAQARLSRVLNSEGVSRPLFSTHRRLEPSESCARVHAIATWSTYTWCLTPARWGIGS